MKREKIIGKKTFLKHGSMVSSQARPIIRKNKKKDYKLSKKAQVEFIVLLSEVLKNGFTLQESLSFIGRLLMEESLSIKKMERMLASGRPLYQCFERIGFSSNHVAQLQLSEIHGDLIGTLEKLAKQMNDGFKQRQSFQRVIAYPMMLLVFLFALLCAMKWFLLPKIDNMIGSGEGDNVGVWFIQNFPMLGVFLIAFLGVMVCLCYFFLRHKSQIEKSEFYVKIPFVKIWYTYYITSFFSYEWGKLLSQGIEFKKIVEMMTLNGTTKLMKEMGKKLQNDLERGISVAETIKKCPFFLQGFSMMIQQGEAKGKLGSELMVYGNRTWEMVIKKLEKWLQWVQPIIFLFVAILIICVYGALLFPIYEGMEGVL